jgi:hypothetical protein
MRKKLNRLVVGKSAGFAADSAYEIGEIRTRALGTARRMGIVVQTHKKGKRGGNGFILQVTRVA